MNLTEQVNEGVAVIEAKRTKEGQTLLRGVVKTDETQMEA